MRNEFANRFGSYKTTLTTLHSGKFKSVWFDQAPAVFTARVAEAGAALDELEEFCTAQETNRTGATEQKAREAAAAEEIAFQMSRALVEWFRDHNDEINAAKVDLSRSKWHSLRDQSFLDQLRLTHSLAKQLVDSEDEKCEQYGISSARVKALAREVDAYAELIAAPQSSIAERKGLTGQMRAKFNAVEAKFVSLDNLVLQFGRTPEGQELIAAYQAARIVRDLGGSGAAKAKPQASAAAPTPPPAA